MIVRRILEGTRTLAIVVTVTGVIWLLAEAGSLRVDTLRAEVVFRTGPESERLVRVEPAHGFAGSVTISVEGPAAAVDALAAALRTPVELEPGMVGVPAEPGRYTVNLAEALRAFRHFREGPVAIVRVDPPQAVIVVDAVAVRRVPVRVEPPPGVLLESPPEVSPATVEARLPEAVAREAGDLVATARLDDTAWSNLPEGRRVVLTVPVMLPPGVHDQALRVVPPQVRVALTVRTAAASWVIPRVPVHVRLAPVEVGRWTIDIPPEQHALTDVTVSGSADLIEQIRTGRLRVVAVVPLSAEDLDRAADRGEAVEKEVMYSEFPTGVRFEARQRTVRLTVRRVEARPALPVPGATP